MHALHRILVYLPDLVTGEEKTAKDVRDFAVDQTNSYGDKAFDWRETESAGRWSSVYPDNVIFGRDSGLKIIKELVDTREGVDKDIQRYIKYLYEETSTYNIADMISSNMSPKGRYYLRMLGLLNYGEYVFNSMFYNTRDYDSLITDKLIDEVKEHPEDWAVVLFDCHY